MNNSNTDYFNVNPITKHFFNPLNKSMNKMNSSKS